MLTIDNKKVEIVQKSTAIIHRANEQRHREVISMTYKNSTNIHIN